MQFRAIGGTICDTNRGNVIEGGIVENDVIERDAIKGDIFGIGISKGFAIGDSITLKWMDG